MIKSVRIIACGIALTLGATGLASAASERIQPASQTQKFATETGEKRLQRRGHRDRHGYRDRRSSRGHHDRHRHRDGYRRGYRDDHRGGYRRNHRNDYRAARHYRSRCWSDSQRSHFRGRPALVSVRVCRDRYGRTYTVRGSARLIRYLRGHRRHW